MDLLERRSKLLQCGFSFLESSQGYALIQGSPEVFIIFSLSLYPAIPYRDTLDDRASSYQLSQEE